MRRLLIAISALTLLLGACGGGDGGGGDDESGAPDGGSDKTLSFADGPPPWPRPSDQEARMDAAGLPQLKAEGKLVHYHAHLDVFYDGERVVVPANIGVGFESISPLHTHAPSGVIHVEADKEDDFTLSQFFTEWGVKAADGCIADKCGDEVAVFVDGSIQDVFAGDLVIKPRAQITLVLGTQPADIPSTFDCKAEQPFDMCEEAAS